MYFTLLNNKNQYAIDNFLSENSLSKKCANYQFLLAYVRKLCYYHKAISICPHGQAVQDVALSRRKLGFDSLWGYQTKDISLRYVFLFYKHLMGIERADQCTIQRIVRPPRRDNEQKTAKHLYLYCFLRNCKFLICIAQTFCRCTENNQDVCLCRARNWYMSSGAIPYNEQKTAKYLYLC